MSTSKAKAAPSSAAARAARRDKGSMERFYLWLRSVTTRGVAWPLITVILWLSFTLMLSSAVKKSPTVDEQSHLFRGIAYVKTGATHFLLGHPLFGSTLAALPLLTESDLRLPVDEPFWDDGNWSLAGDAFLWQLNENPQRLILLGRLATIWETMLLGVIVYRWGRELAGKKTALLGSTLILLDPNVIAHGRLVTTDLPEALFFTLAAYGFWRWSQKPGQISVILIGVAFGLAAATKYNAVLLLPILGLQGMVLAWTRRTKKPLVALAQAGLIAWLTVWAVYGFALRPLPGGAFWEDLLWTMRYFDKPHGAYLFGQFAPNGWWYYFPVTFLLKTPLPTLLLVVWAGLAYVGRLWRGRRSGPARVDHASTLFLLVPFAIYFAASLGSTLNIGYRNLIPMLPFLYLFVVRRVTNGRDRSRRWLFIGLASWLLLISLTTWPDYIPYFNVLAGKKEDNWRLLSDSNIDWGQDLPGLAQWQQSRGVPIHLSYFGTARPSAYGINYMSLPTWSPAPEQLPPVRQPFNPFDPAPGLYAISVTNLHGIVLGQEGDTFAGFREQTPVTRIGGSIFIYEVAARGVPQDVVYAGLRPADLPKPLHARIGTNDVRVRWINADTSFLWPEQGGWLAVVRDSNAESALIELWPETPAAETEAHALLRLPGPPELTWERPSRDSGNILTFLGYKRLDSAGNEIALMTAWRVRQATTRPVQLFVHALGDDDQIVGQWDGLDVEPTSWLPGDVFVQFHSFVIPETLGLEPGQAPTLTTGVYDGETLERFGKPMVLEE